MRFDLSEVEGVIKDRRTVYPEQFSDRKVQKEMIEKILSTAIWAPNHGKTQPWRFTVYSGEGRTQLFNKIESLYRSSEGFNEAKLRRFETRIQRSSAIISLIMKRTPETKIPEIEEIEAVACAAQNVLLMATAYGLGSFWSSPSFLYSEGATQAFGYESSDKILGLIYLGYPEGEWPKSHRKPLEYVVDWVE